MKNFYKISFFLAIFCSCSSKYNIVYVNDIEKEEANSWADFKNIENVIDVGDILKIDVYTVVPEAALPYNNTIASPNNQQLNLNILMLEGYLVDKNKSINFPVLGKVSVDGLSETDLENKIRNLLLKGNHLTNPTVKVRRVNSKFTVLGEVGSPGTYSYYDKEINIFQALGYAGDLTIDGKRKDVTLIREVKGNQKAFNIKLTDSEVLKSPVYIIKNNDVIIVNPNFSKVKSAGFIGSPASVASIASLLLSITLLITNN